jgi:hypothetical protein
LNLCRDLRDCSCEPNQIRQYLIQLDCMFTWYDGVSEMTMDVSRGYLPGRKLVSEPSLQGQERKICGKHFHRPFVHAPENLNEQTTPLPRKWA